MKNSDDNIDDLKKFILSYSCDDLLRSFFILNLWLRNVASPIKIQYLYSLLESIHIDLSADNKITSYKDFEVFCKGVIKFTPSFIMLEDYVPEPDWGEIKYFLDKKFYKIFYGGDLSNPYDFYYSYEIIHRPFEQQYLDLIKRSPVTELRFCLELQDSIFENLKQQKIDTDNIRQGDMEMPSEEFWEIATKFIDGYKPQDIYGPDILNMYTRELIDPEPIPQLDTFVENAYRGRNCRYFFIKKSGKYYPVMPRKWLTVIYDIWGNILKDNYSELVKRLDNKSPNVLIGIELAHFIKDRTKEDYIFPHVTPIGEDQIPPHELRYTALLIKDKLFLIYTTPPLFDGDELNKHLDEITPKLKISSDLVKNVPIRLAVFSKRQTLELQPSKVGLKLDSKFIIAIPSPVSDVTGRIAIPDGIDAEIMTLDQIAGIFDELKKPSELNDFFDYLVEERKMNRMSGMNSYLDKFGSFKDSHGVLVPGALEPDMIMLDFNWGSNYRFKSLGDFWAVFPEESFFGHPRSWTIPPERRTATGFILDSRIFRGYAYYQKIDKAIVFINAPVHMMDLEDGKVADPLMQSLFDAIDIYPEILKKLDLTKSQHKLQVFFCPSTLASTHDELKHVRHLVQHEKMWSMDIARIRSRDYGIRVVYNPKKIIETLQVSKDRSVQISLLMDVLEQINNLLPQSNFESIRSGLESEKIKKIRFKMFAVEKIASFPEGVSEVIPDQREYKIADKEIALIAKKLNITPGKYSSGEAKEKLNNLRAEIVNSTNKKIEGYNFVECLPMLLEKSNVLIHEYWRNKAEVKASIEGEVDYERSEKSSDDEKDFLHWYRNYRYVIEKFVQLQPNGTTVLDTEKLKELMALVDRLMDVYVASDFINYEIYPVSVEINRDYVVSTSDDANDISAMEREYGEEQAKINLGIIGNKEDTADSSLSVEDYLNELDQAFKTDLGFGLKNLINVQQVLALWSGYTKSEEDTHYSATVEEISAICSKEIKGYDPAETGLILEFLTLKPEEILVIKGDPKLAQDVPIWEHNKRLARFDIRPLIKVASRYYWGPHSIERTSRVWMGISSKHRLPSDLETPNIKSVLNKGHVDLENSLVNKIKEVVSRYTTKVQTSVYPHKCDSTTGDIGDIDVLAYLEDKNILLNIESKIIDPPHSNKDSGRMQRRTFVSYKGEDGRIRKCDVEKVLDRESYLKCKSKELLAKFGWKPQTSDPKIVSVFVTKMGFWWTKHPPVVTDIKFVEIRMLSDFIKALTKA